MAGSDHGPPEPGPDAGTADLQADIERTRAELGQTAQALTDKLDVKARVTASAQEAKNTVVRRATTADGSVKPVIPLAAVAAVAVVLGIVVWRRRR
jgi:hypothetical protein